MLLSETPKIAGAASPFGSSDLKCPSSPRLPKAFHVGISYEQKAPHKVDFYRSFE